MIAEISHFTNKKAVSYCLLDYSESAKQFFGKVSVDFLKRKLMKNASKKVRKMHELSV